MSPGFEIFLEDGRKIRVHTMHERMREGMFDGDFLFDRAAEAHREATRGAPTSVAGLSRGGRPTSHWLHELRSSSARYRVAAVRDDELLDVLRDPRVEQDARVAAAVRLATSEDPGMRAKIRIAADEVADPKLRAAIDAALSEDQDALLRALDAI